MMKADTGCSDLECLGFGGTSADFERDDRLELLIKQYMKTAAIHRADMVREGYARYYISGDKVSTNTDRTGLFNFITVDGANAYIPPIGSPEGDLGQGRVINIEVDINGSKKPNTFGRDIFFISILDSLQVVPYRGMAYAQYASPDGWNQPGMCFYWNNRGGCEVSCGIPGSKNFLSNADGMACAARIIENSWEIDY